MTTRHHSAARLLAVDPSLTCSGWALFRLSDEKLLGVGKLRSLSPKVPLNQRYEDLQRKIESIFDGVRLCDRDVLICEAPTTMRDPRAAFKVEQVRGIFETLARARAVQTPGRLNPRSVHKEVLGLKGKQLPRAEIKSMACHVVMRLFSEPLQTLGFEPEVENLARHQDIVDAILIGYLGLSRLKTAGLAEEELGEFWQRRRSFRRANG